MQQKSRRTIVSATVALLTAVLAFAVVKPALSATTPVRIMALGDSITAGTGCWRAYLWNHLQTTGYTNIDFVGGVSDGGGCNPGFSYDWDHEGHGGYSATGIADNNQLPPWLDAADPDVVLVHLGTNDMWGGYIPLATKLAAFTKLIGQIRANNPSMKIIVAQIIPMSEAACATCPADVKAFDDALPAWAAGLTTAQSPISLVDQWTGFDAVADTGDGVHPNDGGYRKMADRWYPALTAVLNGTSTTPTTPAASSPSASPSASPSPSPSVSPSASTSPTVSPSASVSPSAPATAGSCTATYRVANQWPGGFQGEVTVHNDLAATSSAWTVTLNFGGGQLITQAWNATVTQSGSTATARNASWNGGLAAGAATTFGFQATGTGTDNATAVTCAAL